jgi:hypothetical protein
MCLHLAAWALRRRRHRRRPMAASAYINYNYFVIVLTSVFFLFSMMRDFNLVVNICLFPFLNDARFQLRSFLFGFLCYPFVSISFITLHIVLPFAFVAALILGVVKQVCRMERRNGVRSELHPYA